MIVSDVCPNNKSVIDKQWDSDPLVRPIVIFVDKCLLCPGQTLLPATMGSVLSTPYIEKNYRVTHYKCPSPSHFSDDDYSQLFSPADFSPLLSSVYDPAKNNNNF